MNSWSTHAKACNFYGDSRGILTSKGKPSSFSLHKRMLRGYSLVIGPSVTTNTNTTTDEPRKNGLRRGKWVLRSVRRPGGTILFLCLSLLSSHSGFVDGYWVPFWGSERGGKYVCPVTSANLFALTKVTLIGGKSVGSMGSIQFLIIMRLGWGWNPHFLVIIRD